MAASPMVSISLKDAEDLLSFLAVHGQGRKDARLLNVLRAQMREAMAAPVGAAAPAPVVQPDLLTVAAPEGGAS